VKTPETWSATRSTTTDLFEQPRKIATGVRNATIGPHGLEMIALVATENQPALVTSKRENLSDTFTQFLPIDSISSIPKPDSPLIGIRGNTLLFQRDNDLTARGVDFVYSTRSGPSGLWSSPQVLPMSDVPLIDKRVSGPCLVDQGLTLWLSQGEGREAYIMKSTRAKFTDTFRRFDYLKINGRKIHGSFPRYVESTGELFYSASTKSDLVGMWELAVVHPNGGPGVTSKDAELKDANPNFDPSFVHEVNTLPQYIRELRSEYVRLLKISSSTKELREIDRLLSSPSKLEMNTYYYSIATDMISKIDDQAITPLLLLHILEQAEQNKSSKSAYSIIKSLSISLSSFTNQTLSYSSISSSTMTSAERQSVMLGEIESWLLERDQKNSGS
jgi:hypothetical protein